MSRTVPACDDSCDTPNWSPEETRWCCFDVEKPHTEWDTVDERSGSQDCWKRTETALENVRLLLVQEAHEVGPAVQELYDSMRDPIIGIDTEWKPDDRSSSNDIAMLQLASSSVVLLIRTCMLEGGLPQEVIDFCRDENVVGVGFSWGTGDENKMLDSFGLGSRDLFSHFVDVRMQAGIMGYHDISLASLAKLLLGFAPPSSKQVTLSNWESTFLHPRQLLYAALDAVVTGDLLRALRELHATQPSCSGCSLPLGAWPQALDLHCHDLQCQRKKPFATPASLLAHMRQKGHASSLMQCTECGRAMSSTRAASIQTDAVAAGQRNRNPSSTTLHEPRAEPYRAVHAQMATGSGDVRQSRYLPPMGEDLSHSYAGTAEQGGISRRRRDRQIYTAYNAYQ